MGDRKPKSPCVKRCKIDKDSGLCTGCQRTQDEISSWKRLSTAQREEVLQAVQLRRTSPAASAKGSQSHKSLAKALCRLLADTHALGLKAHSLRWNAQGPLSGTLQPVLEGQRAELGTAADQIAARIRALDAPVPDGVGAVRRLACVRQSAKKPSTARAMIRQLARDQAAVARSARSILAAARGAGDDPSAQLLARRVQAHEQAAERLRALIRREPASRPII